MKVLDLLPVFQEDLARLSGYRTDNAPAVLAAGCILHDPALATVTDWGTYVAAKGPAIAACVQRLASAANVQNLPACFLLNEQYIVKPPRAGQATAFAVHRDCEHVHPHRPFVSAWLALDDIALENGALFLMQRRHLPYPRDADLPDQEDSSLWVPQYVSAGELVVIDCCRPHYSEENRDERRPRRAFMPQFLFCSEQDADEYDKRGLPRENDDAGHAGTPPWPWPLRVRVPMTDNHKPHL